MASHQWKNFDFFDKVLLSKDKSGPASIVRCEITAVVAGAGGFVFFGDADGCVHIMNHNYSVHKFRAHNGSVTQLFALQDQSLLVSIGGGIDPRSNVTRQVASAAVVQQRQANPGGNTNDVTISPSAKRRNSESMPPCAVVCIWDTSNSDKSTVMSPVCVRRFRVFDSRTSDEVAVTALATSDDLKLLSIGLNSGEIIMFQVPKAGHMGGDIPPHWNIKPKSSGKISHLSFCTSRKLDLKNSTMKKKFSSKNKEDTKIHLFIVTTSGIESHLITGKKQLHSNDQNSRSNQNSITLDQTGSTCAALVDGDGIQTKDGSKKLAVGQPGAVFFFGPEDRGQCFAFKGKKNVLASVGALTNEGTELSTYNNINSGRYLLVGGDHVAIYDLVNRFIAFHMNLGKVTQSSMNEESHTISFAVNVSLWNGRVIMLTSTNQMWALQEKSTNLKLEYLFKKNMYSLALSILENESLMLTNSPFIEDANMLDSLRRSINDVHRMFGDHLYKRGDFKASMSQYILTIGYLEPSYVIDRFLGSTAKMSLLTKYTEELYLYHSSVEHTALLLSCYIKTRDDDELRRFIRREGKWKIRGDGIEAVVSNYDVAVAIKTLREHEYYDEALFLADRHHKHQLHIQIQLEDLSCHGDALEYISRLSFDSANAAMMKYGKTLVKIMPRRASDLLQRLCTTYAADMNDDSEDNTDSNVFCEPEDFFHCFADKPVALQEFLQFVLKKRGSNISSSITRTVPWDTLLELLLCTWEDISKPSDNSSDINDSNDLTINVKGDDSQARKDIMDLLTNPDACYDVDYALCLVQIHGFVEGQLFLFTKLRLYSSVLELYTDRESDVGIIQMCKEYGENDPNLWVHLLTHLSSKYCNSSTDSTEIYEKEEELTEVLEHIDSHDLIPAIMVLNILSSNTNIPVRVVKPYLLFRFEREDEQLNDDLMETNEFIKESDRMKERIKILQTEAQIFSNRKCAKTGFPLELPSVHFMKGKSYNLEAIGEDGQCPSLGPQIQHVHEIRQQLKRKAQKHEKFFEELESSADGFGKIAEYFGRGTLDIMGT